MEDAPAAASAECLQPAEVFTDRHPQAAEQAAAAASSGSAASTPTFWTPRHSSASGGGSLPSAAQVRTAPHCDTR